MRSIGRHIVTVALVLVLSASVAFAEATGVVVLHGNGHPTKLIQGLVDDLKEAKFLVASPELPWSEDRRYDEPVESAVQQVREAFDQLKSQGATKFVLAGHSKGGVFALYYASQNKLDGLIGIAPGANVASGVFKEKLGDSVAKAKKMVNNGKGDQKSTFQDFEGSRGLTDVQTMAASYFSWFKRKGAMNSNMSAQKLSADIPVLWIVPTDDYPGLKKMNTALFSELPKNPKTRLYQPSSDHKSAPSDSSTEIISWTNSL